MTRRQRSRRHVCRKRRIIAPDGNPVKVATHGIGRFSEDVELREVVGDDDFLWAHAPAFHADANAVIDVCAARGWSAEFHRDGATIRKWDDEYLRIEREWYEQGEPREAAARALLAALTAEAAQP